VHGAEQRLASLVSKGRRKRTHQGGSAPTRLGSLQIWITLSPRKRHTAHQ